MGHAINPKQDPAPVRPGLQLTASTFLCACAAIVVSVLIVPLLTGFACADVPSFTKNFAPDAIGPGSSSRLTFTIGNNTPTGIRGLSFEDNLPAGVNIASPANLASGCGGSVSAPDGGNVISLTDGSVPANGSCGISVDVTSAEVGTHMNASGDLLSDEGNSGSAMADLTVSANLPGFSASFSLDQIGFGGRSTLTFTIDNSKNDANRVDLMFSNALPAGVVVADPANASTSCVGGQISAIPGSNVISYAPVIPGFDVLESGQICKVSVDVIGLSVGAHANVSGELTSADQQTFTPVSSGFTSATLSVSHDQISIRKSFVDDPVPPGGTATLEFTITNRSRESEASGISFTDNLNATLQGLEATNLPLTDICGIGSQLTGGSTISLTNGRLGAGEACSFRVSLGVPAGAQPGLYPNATSPITAIADGNFTVGTPARDTLVVLPVPRLTADFIDDPTIPGGKATLEFAITNTSLSSLAADIAFDIELPGEFPSVASQPDAGFCGAGSTIIFAPATPDVSAALLITGASLAAGDTCTFRVVLDVSQSASGGTLTGTTSPITATINGVQISGAPASADLLIVSAPQLTKTFLEDRAQPGGTVMLQFTLEHSAEAPSAATEIEFTDDLGAAIPGMIATGTPRLNICGAGSILTGAEQIVFKNGTLNPGETCIFEVPVTIPAQTSLGAVTISTSPVSATVAGIKVASAAAKGDLLVTNLSFSKRFLESSVIPGGTATVEFTIRNDGAVAATNLAFVDNLDETLPGLVSVSAPQSNICGNGSEIQGTNLLVFQGGMVAPQSSCTFSVKVQVPEGAEEGTYINATNSLVADIGGTPLELPPATAALEVMSTLLEITKEFVPDPAIAGGTTNLEFMVKNLDPVRAVQGITFTDALPSGLRNGGGSQSNICGAGSQISGTNTLTFSGGTLPAGGSCTFSVPIQVPVGAPESIFNTTSAVSGLIDGLQVRGESAAGSLQILSGAAGVTLTVLGPPVLEGSDGVIRQQVRVTNGNPVAVSGFRILIRNLPAGVAVRNATGTNPQGVPYIDRLQPLAPNEGVIVTVEYFRLSGDPNFDPDYQLEFDNPGGVPPSGPFQIDRVASLPGKNILVEWTATVGKLYNVEWSENMNVWNEAGSPILAVTKTVQWVDDGPPETRTPPASQAWRFYRVVEKGNP